LDDTVKATSSLLYILFSKPESAPDSGVFRTSTAMATMRKIAHIKRIRNKDFCNQIQLDVLPEQPISQCQS